jgi:Asp/Glu/hydantoin racemase
LKAVVFIHTVPPLIPVFNDLGLRILPGVQILHVLDEPLLKLVQQQGAFTASDRRRLKDHLDAARQSGASAALVTCSTISPLVDLVRNEAPIPTLKIDEAMIDEAVERGSHIGVLATTSSTLGPTRAALEQRARDAGRRIRVYTVLIENALQLLLQGRGREHDRLITEAIARLHVDTDLVVLAQASMARVLDTRPEQERRVPVLASPHLALERMKQHL